MLLQILLQKYSLTCILTIFKVHECICFSRKEHILLKGIQCSVPVITIQIPLIYKEYDALCMNIVAVHPGATVAIRKSPVLKSTNKVTAAASAAVAAASRRASAFAIRFIPMSATVVPAAP